LKKGCSHDSLKNSWRIGIDTKTKTELVTNGLFSISRNPIFFGMIITLIGVFLATPNALTVLLYIRTERLRPHHRQHSDFLPQTIPK
jgi:protein-S-isoprenylcysteine O-methyltransferase Ste14